MLYNYLVTALRNILKYRFFSLINIMGLSVGLAAVMLISLYIWDEYTFDSYLNQSESLYKLELESNMGGRRQNPVTGGAAAIALPIDYPELVENAARLNHSDAIITLENRSNSEEIYYSDASFFSLFNIEYVEGDATTAMPDQSTIAISQSMAVKYFGNDPAMGQLLEFDNGNTYRVGAVFRDFPVNTHLRPNFLVPMAPSGRDNPADFEGWFSIGYRTYVKLTSVEAEKQLTALMPQFIDSYLEERSEGDPMSNYYGLRLIKIGDVHFETAAQDAGDPTILIGFAAIALIILSIATFNFMNMSISRTVVRAREVAVRKALGAKKRNIIGQFLSETFVTVIVSLTIAIVITELTLPWFNDFAEKIMSSGIIASPIFILGMVALVLFVALTAGYYPASIMSNFRPATILRGGKANSKSMSKFRSILVTGQFAVAIALTIAAVIVYQQIQYSKNFDPGFRKENVILIEGLDHDAVSANVKSLQQRLLAHPDITDVSLVDQTPGTTYSWIEAIERVNGMQLEQPVPIRGMIIDENFVDAFGVNLVAGRNLSHSRADDIARQINQDWKEHSNIFLNEQALRVLGLGSPSEAIGKTIGQNDVYTVVGVIGDYMRGSTKSNIEPMHFIIDEQGARIAAVRFQTNDLSSLLTFVDEAWTSIAGDRPIRRDFLDERMNALYKIEQQQGQIFAIFAGLAVIVSCIGLYGLASFNVAQRTKEIGLRKALGASSSKITKHILWDFSKPVLLANVIAWPIAFYIMSDWLTRFNYRIELGVIPFTLAGILALAVAWFTIGGHAIRVARSNPIYALRCE